MENHLVIGAKITDQVQEELDKVLPAHHFYFKEDNPDYLQIVRVDGQKVIGKKLTPGMPVNKLGDYAVNVKSILKKICPDHGWSDSDIKIFVLTLIG